MKVMLLSNIPETAVICEVIYAARHSYNLTLLAIQRCLQWHENREALHRGRGCDTELGPWPLHSVWCWYNAQIRHWEQEVSEPYVVSGWAGCYCSLCFPEYMTYPLHHRCGLAPPQSPGRDSVNIVSRTMVSWFNWVKQLAHKNMWNQNTCWCWCMYIDFTFFSHFEHSVDVDANTAKLKNGL